MSNPRRKVKDSRKDVRSHISIPIEYEKKYTIVKEKEVKKAVTKDISGGGIRFKTDEDLPKGLKLSLKIKIPNQEKFFTIDAEIIHFNKIDNNTYEMGAKFLNLSPQIKEAINTLYYISFFQKK